MRDSPGSRPFTRRTATLASLLMATSVAGGSVVMPDSAQAGAQRASQSFKRPSLTLKSRVRSKLRRAAAEGDVLPFTLRLRRPYEGGAGDDVVALAWDDAATPWPLDGTAPAPGEASTHLDGALTYEWDYSADTTGYATQGTVETNIGGGVSLTGTGFPIAAPAGASCSALAALDATGVSFTPAGARFGMLNPFSGEVSGTLGLRTTIRTRAVPCGGDPATAPTALARPGRPPPPPPPAPRGGPPAPPPRARPGPAAPAPPLPVAFNGRFTMSPAITSDGRIRVGVLRVNDSAQTPQRTTFGFVHACADPAAADGCDRRAFPVRTKMVSFSAEGLVGDAMPAAPADPAPPAVAAPAAVLPSPGAPATL